MKEMQDSQCFFHRFIQLFPLGCAFCQVIRSENGEVEDLIVHACNEAYLAINGVKNAQVVGKRISEAFPRLAPRMLAQLQRLGEHERVARFTSVYDPAYRVSAFFAEPTLLFTIYEDARQQPLQESCADSVPCTFSGSAALERTPKFPMVLPSEPGERARKDTALLFSGTSRADEENGAAFHDSLTGLYDRRFAVRAFDLLNTKENLPLSIILGDVNGLKLTNDMLGYRAGDEVLVKIARIFTSNCRATDLVARWSGDEFLTILPGTSREEAQEITHRLQRAFREACGSAAHISVALGYATRENETLTDELFQEAEVCILRKKLLMGRSHRNSTINLLLSILYEKSAETQEHSERMADHCHKIAMALKLSDEQINGLILLAMLH
ncbi:MAG TPA: diguanylate cyclase, partial [Clostridia bacterium]|nr:diguanylate cyclase [Clostridia bacterium]